MNIDHMDASFCVVLCTIVGGFLLNKSYACENLMVATLPDDRLSSSSVYDNTDYYYPKHAKLSSSTGWSPGITNSNPWIQADFGEVVRIIGVITKAMNGLDEYVKKYKVRYSNTASTWTLVKKSPDNIFTANTDRWAEVRNNFPSVVEARYLRLAPTDCHNHCSLRFDVVGCEVLTTTSTTTTSTRANQAPTTATDSKTSSTTTHAPTTTDSITTHVPTTTDPTTFTITTHAPTTTDSITSTTTHAPTTTDSITSTTTHAPTTTDSITSTTTTHAPTTTDSMTTHEPTTTDSITFTTTTHEPPTTDSITSTTTHARTTTESITSTTTHAPTTTDSTISTITTPFRADPTTSTSTTTHAPTAIDITTSTTTTLTSATTITPTTSISTSTSSRPTSSITMKEACLCACVNKYNNTLTQAELDVRLSDIVQNLTIPKKTTSRFIRSKISVPDNRPEVVYVGSVAIVFMIIVASLIVLPDLYVFSRFLFLLFKKKV